MDRDEEWLLQMCGPIACMIAVRLRLDLGHARWKALVAPRAQQFMPGVVG